MKSFKTIVVLLFAMIMVVSKVFCQEITSLSIGPSLSFKAGVNAAEVMEGRKNALGFAGIPDFGVSGLMMLSPSADLGVTADLGLSNYAYKIKGVDVAKEYTMRYSYIALGTAFYFSGFTFGFNFGVPVAANYGNTIKTSTIGFMTEFKVGGMIPLKLDESGSLNLIFNASYMLSGIYDDYVHNDPLLQYIPEVPPYNISTKYNHRALSFNIGINYLFNLDI